MNEFVQNITNWMEALSSLPPWVAAGLILIIGLILAKAVEVILVGILNRTEIDERLARTLGLKDTQTEKAIGRFVFYLLMLFVFVTALDVANLSEQVTRPLHNILDQISGYIPNILGAGLLAILTFVGASLIRRIIQGLLLASRVDERLGLGEERPLSTAIETVVFFLIILIALPWILGLLGIPAVQETVTPLVQRVIDYIPLVIGGGLIIAFGVLLGTIVRKMLTAVLHATGLDRLPDRLGYQGKFVLFGHSLSGALGYIAMISIVVTSIAEGIKTMKLGLVSNLAEFLARLWGATLIFLIGLFLGDLTKRAIAGRNVLFGTVAQYVVIVFFGGMALQKAEITELSSTLVQYLIAGAVVAAVVAFGVGGAIAIGLGAKDEVKEGCKKLFSRFDETHR